MTALFTKVNALLERQVPELRIYLRTETNTRYFRASPLLQTAFGGLVAVGFSWMIISSTALVLDHMSTQSDKTQAEVLQRAYETRLAELSLERDQLAQESGTAQERYYVALGQISQQQSELLNTAEERRELATSLKIMQQKLQTAVGARDAAQKNSDAILAEMQAVSGSLSTKLGGAQDNKETLIYLTRELKSLADERDKLRVTTNDMQNKVAEMNLDAKLRRQQDTRIFSRLEQAVEMTLVPLNKALKRSGVDTENLLNEVRKGYSGTGGPLTPLAVSTKGAYSDPLGDQTTLLLRQLDRVGLMKIAMQKLPLAVPVNGSFRHTSGFGYRNNPTGGGRRLHKGTDFAAPRGTAIVAPGDGVVTFAGRQRGFGNLIKLRHASGFETYFAHLNRIRVKAGQRVSLGDRIGDMGSTGHSTGNHLHYEIHINGKPVNPLTYMKAPTDVF